MSEDSRSQERENSNRQAADQEKQARAAKEQMMRVIFTSEARDRLNNVRMVKPDLASSIENQIIQLASSGRLRHQVSDEELKEMLGQMQRPKKDFKINWK